MVLKKWNYSAQAYDIVELEDGNYVAYSDDMNEIVNCPHCHKEFRYGDGYTSKEFQTAIGFGYCVCKECHDKEYERERKFNNK